MTDISPAKPQYTSVSRWLTHSMNMLLFHVIKTSSCWFNQPQELHYMLHQSLN